MIGIRRIILPGVYDATIQPAGPKGTPAIIVTSGFEVKAPEIVSVEPNDGTAGDQITIDGHFFGTSKGKIYLDYEQGENPVRKSL